MESREPIMNTADDAAVLPFSAAANLNGPTSHGTSSERKASQEMVCGEKKSRQETGC